MWPERALARSDSKVPSKCSTLRFISRTAWVRCLLLRDSAVGNSADAFFYSIGLRWREKKLKREERERRCPRELGRVRGKGPFALRLFVRTTPGASLF